MSTEPLKMEALKAGLDREARKLKLDFNQLKSGGFIKQTQKDLFTVRLRCPGGMLTPEKLRVAAQIADKYGQGQVHLSVRQSVEIPYVHYQHFDAVGKELAEVDWSVASCGPRVRVPTACGGCRYNPNGLMDTQALCAEVDRRFFGTPTDHHKFKMSFSGCPIDCFRTRDMDLGFQGMVEPELDTELCNGCGLCVKGCEDAALAMDDGLPIRDLDRCNYCGDCIKVCPVDAMLPKRLGWLARAGGKHGKHPLFAYEVAQFLDDEQACSLIEKTLEWYRENATGRERIGAAMARSGLQAYLDQVVKPLGLDVIEDPAARHRYRAGGNFYG